MQNRFTTATASESFSDKSHGSVGDHLDVSDLMLGPAVVDAEIDGMDIESAAQSLGVAQDDVWRRIRNGQLIARSNRGKVFVYTGIETAESSRQAEEHLLPPPPSAALPHEVILSRIDASESRELTTSGLVATRDDLVVLMEHLSQAKEENREIIRFTSESMNRLTDLTDSMLKMKDEVIVSREQQVELLNEQLKSQHETLKKLTREKENLETVARFINS